MGSLRARTVLGVAIFAFCSGFQSTAFDGCAPGAGPGGVIPPSDEPVCIDDLDCPATGCEDVRCITGRCMVVGPTRDLDGDGEGPPPCGIDCDDTDPAVHPGADELCDGADQDCDGNVDEMAPPGVRRSFVPLVSERTRAAALGTGVVLLHVDTTPGLSASTIGFDGTLGPSLVVDPGEAPDLYDVATTDAGAVAVVFHASTGRLEGIPLGDPLSVGLRFMIADLSTLPALLDLRAESLPFGSAGSILGVTFRDATGDGWVWLEGMSGPRLAGSEGFAAAPDLASDGTSIAITLETSVAAFLDRTGAETMRQTIPGSSSWSSTFDPPFFPLASDRARGRVVAVVPDAFDAAIFTMTPTTASALRPTPSPMPRGLPARMDVGPSFAVLTRFDDGITFPTTGRAGVWCWALDGDSLGAVSSFTPDEIVGTGMRATDWDVVVSESGTAVLTSLGTSGTSVATLSCGG